jgi:hypothetical protein
MSFVTDSEGRVVAQNNTPPSELEPGAQDGRAGPPSGAPVRTQSASERSTTVQAPAATTIPAGTNVHVFSPDQARTGYEPCKFGIAASEALAGPDGVEAMRVSVDGQTRTFPYDPRQQAATLTGLDSQGRKFRESVHLITDCRWHRAADGSTFFRHLDRQPLDPNETILGEAVRDGERIAVTSAGRKVVLDDEGMVIRRLVGPAYASEAQQ